MHRSKGRLWLERELIFSLKRVDCDIASGITCKTRRNPQTESVSVELMSWLKFSFSGLQAAMTPSSVC